MKNRYTPAYIAAFTMLVMSAPVGTLAQVAATPAPADPAKEKDEQVIVLSPFEVSAEATNGYAATTTLAGNRLATELRDVGNAVTVITREFMNDIGATDNKSLLQYTTNTEVGGYLGNYSGNGDSSHLDESSKFINPNTNTRVRGLTSADNTRDFFLTDIPWEGYNIDGVDLQRGPNSILFGQGSPAGIINSRSKPASYKDSNEVSLRVGSWGSTRMALDVNRVLIKNQLAFRLAAVDNHEKYKQKPAYSEQKRLYAAARWEPEFMKMGGSARTILKANIEFGDIKSNNPRQLPPNDRITPWFYTGKTSNTYNVANQPFAFSNWNKAVVNSKQNEDDNTGVPGNGLDRPSHNGPGGIYPGTLTTPPPTGYVKYAGNPNEFYQPWDQGSALGFFGAPLYNFQYNNATQGQGVNWEPTSGAGLTSTGGLNTAGILPYLRPASVASYSAFARNARMYYNGLPAWQFGIFKDKSLTDASVFDFYNKLLDGPTKKEWQKFRVYNLSLAQTFFHDMVGFEGTYNNEWVRNGKVQLLTDDSINIDFNSVYNNGTANGAWADGTANPNLGKAFVGGQGLFGNSDNTINRESGRFTAFLDYDFSKKHSGWFTKLIGRHVLTGVLSGDKVETDNRDFSRYSITNTEWMSTLPGNRTLTPTTMPSFMSGQMSPFSLFYLGNSLLSASSAAGANLSNVQVNPAIVSGTALNFDTTWKPSRNSSDASYVDPAAPWWNNYYPKINPISIAPDGLYRDEFGNPFVPDSSGTPQPHTVDSAGNVVATGTAGGTVKTPAGMNTQSNNPANYVGFRQYPITVMDSLASRANQDANTHSARLTKSKVFSRAFNWQAHFWDNAVVATVGVRKDIAKSYQYSLNTGSASSLVSNNSRLNLASTNYKLPDTPGNKLEVTSHAWTAVLHMNEIAIFKKLPLQISLFYNHSTDFQPAAQRVDIYGVPLSAPSGKTKDVGILLETNDGKYSLKLNKYNTASVNSSSSGLGSAWYIGASQAWGANWANRFEFNWTGDTIANAVTNDPNNTQYNYEPAPGETLAQAQAREASVIAAWRAWQKSVDPRFYAAWGINLNDNTKSVGTNVPNGFAVTEDSNSQGYEVEFNASPLKNWRVTLNASKTTAQRTNIGGTNLSAFVAAYTKAVNTPGTGYTGNKGGAGDLRIWWGGAGNTTQLQDWNGSTGSEFNQRKLQEGTNVPELREWRYNAITNYDFDHGKLKGMNVGGGVRYESSVVIGYEPIKGTPPNDVIFNLSAPYMGPSETNFDLWIGYTRKLRNKITWNVQLNVRNVGVGNELIPITTEPDGTGATYRIRAPQQVMLTNTFRF